MTREQLNQTYTKNGIVLALGAGVSVDSGLPNWVELLRRVCVESGCGAGLVDDLRGAGFGLPAIAGMLRAHCPPDRNFAEIVRKCLYQTFPEDLHGASWRNWGDLVPYIHSHNPTLRSVAALCAVATGSQPVFVRNRFIRAIVNFNLDAVFRVYVHARYGDPLLVRTIERPSKSSELAKINVYYMHGFLRFDSKAGDLEKEGVDKLVLSEHEYFDFFNSPTSLFNYTFLSLLREHPCLFIGLSMQDDNIRRLLHYSTRERYHAYLEEGKSPKKAREKVRRHFAILKYFDSGAVNTAVERSLAELGTSVLWIARYEEIPEILAQMYSAGGGNWGAVY